MLIYSAIFGCDENHIRRKMSSKDLTKENTSCQCGCGSPDHNTNTTNGRRQFLKAAGLMGLGLGLAPAALGSLLETPGKAKEMASSGSVQKGKASKITLLHTADIHGQLNIHDEFFWENGKAVYKKRGGMATLKTMINRVRKENPGQTILVDGGDCFQGSAVAALSKGAAMIPVINDLGYDITLPGNWEVVYGKEMLLNDLGGYKAQKICANMYHDTNDDQNGELLFPPYYIHRIGNLKIGFIGYNDPLTGVRQSPEYSKGIRYTHPEENVSRYIKMLRHYEKCELVFLVTHLGLSQQVLLANQPYVDGVDYILGADTHERVRTPIDGKYTKLTEPGAFGSFLGRLDLVLENGKIVDQGYELLDVDPSKYEEDEEMKKIIHAVSSPYHEETSKVIGKTKTPLVRYFVLETPMDNLVTDALKWKAKTDIALSNGFRFCPPLVPGNDGTAEITKDFLWSMLPVNSKVRTGLVTGLQIMEWLEQELENTFAQNPAKRFGGWLVRFQGMKITFTISKEKGSRIDQIMIGKNKLDPAGTYTIAACEREGDSPDTVCRIKGVREVKDMDYSLHTAVVEYLAEHSPVSPVIEGRAVATDAPSTLLSQLDGINYSFR
jgi:2',3'-cyclic-nucleotide 2'-phosphodiesterase (5'-nucleotidase family)